MAWLRTASGLARGFARVLIRNQAAKSATYAKHIEVVPGHKFARHVPALSLRCDAGSEWKPRDQNVKDIRAPIAQGAIFRLRQADVIAV